MKQVKSEIDKNNGLTDLRSGGNDREGLEEAFGTYVGKM